VRLILDSLKRSTMGADEYRLVEGWQHKWRCGINAGQVRLSQTISQGGTVPPIPTDPRCAPDKPSFDYVPQKSEKPKCEEISGQAQLDAWLGVGAMHGDEAYVRCLLKRGANANARDAINSTPLLYAISSQQEKTSWLLLKSGAQVDVTSTEGMTVMLAAADWADLALVNELIRKGADILQPAITGVTPLMLAASKCKTDVVRILIAKGANVSTKDEDGRDALAWSTMSGCTAVAPELKKRTKALTQ
jgi:ankyrin repeat protein